MSPQREASGVAAGTPTVDRRPRLTCPYHRDRQVTTEIEGRVLVCDECAADPELRNDAKKDWR